MFLQKFNKQFDKRMKSATPHTATGSKNHTRHLKTETRWLNYQ